MFHCCRLYERGGLRFNQ